jgi:hypothetical protein
MADDTDDDTGTVGYLSAWRPRFTVFLSSWPALRSARSLISHACCANNQ